MARDGSYPVVVHQDKEPRDSASVNSTASRSSNGGSRPSSTVSNDSYASDSASMWSDKQAALIQGSKTRVHPRNGQLVTVYNGRR